MAHLPLLFPALCPLLVILIITSSGSVSCSCAPDVLLARHNHFRARHGVPPLTWNATIEAVASSYAKHLAATGQLVHSKNPNYGENLAANGAAYDMSLMIDAMYSEEIRRYHA